METKCKCSADRSVETTRVTPRYSGHGPDTPGVEFLILLIGSSESHKYNKHTLSLPHSSLSLTFTLSLSLPHELFLSLTSSPPPWGPRVQIPHLNLISRLRKLQSAWITLLPMSSFQENLGFQVLWARKAHLRYLTCAAPIYVSRRF